MCGIGILNELSGRRCLIDKWIIRSSGSCRARRNERKKRYATKEQPLHIGLSSMTSWLSLDIYG